MTLACLVFQALASVAAARYFARHGRRAETSRSWRKIFLQFSMLMVILMLGNIVQIVLWAGLYRVFGAVRDFEEALYFSGVTFTSLGYGDVVLQGRIRLLAPLQAANGLMMFGVTTAVFIAAVERSIARRSADPPVAANG
jgi:hypothetical protein